MHVVLGGSEAELEFALVVEYPSNVCILERTSIPILETLKTIDDFQNLMIYPVVFITLEAWKLNFGRSHFYKVSVIGLT